MGANSAAPGVIFRPTVADNDPKINRDFNIFIVSISTCIEKTIGVGAAQDLVSFFFLEGIGTHTSTSFFKYSRRIRVRVLAGLPFDQLILIIAHMSIFVKNWYGIIYFMANNLFNVKKSKSIFLAKKAIKDKDTRERVILYASTAVNYFFVIFQLYGGIRYGFAWFAALGVYYAVLTSINLYIGLSCKKERAQSIEGVLYGRVGTGSG